MNKPISKIISANNLKSGFTVYLGKNEWVSDINDAVVITDEETQTKLNSIALQAVEDNILVGFYHVDVDIIEDENQVQHITPVAIREKMRVTGPSIDYHPKD